MQDVLERAKLKLVSYCHLRPVSIPIPCQVPVDQKIFPAAEEGFEDFSVVTRVVIPGYRMGLVDASGLTHAEFEERARACGYEKDTRPADFLRCLEFCMEEHCQPFPFERIAAYPEGGDPVAAVRTDTGFRRASSPSPGAPWEPGTLILVNALDL